MHCQHQGLDNRSGVRAQGFELGTCFTSRIKAVAWSQHPASDCCTDTPDSEPSAGWLCSFIGDSLTALGWGLSPRGRGPWQRCDCPSYTLDRSFTCSWRCLKLWFFHEMVVLQFLFLHAWRWASGLSTASRLIPWGHHILMRTDMYRRSSGDGVRLLSTVQMWCSGLLLYLKSKREKL